MTLSIPTIDDLRQTGAIPAYFGLGFIQLKVSDVERYHFWHPSLAPATASPEEIHDHRYDFQSTILAGRMLHETFGFDYDEDGLWQIDEVSCKPGGAETARTIARVSLRKTGFYEMGAGSSYTFSVGEFHRTLTNRCATRLVRTTPEKSWARVIRPLGTAHVCPFRQSIPVDEAWAIIADLLPSTPRGYHSREIERGTFGEPSKIREETEEFLDAVAQGAKVMELVELSDLYGAIEGYLAKAHPAMTMADLATMAKLTERAFKSGSR